MLRMIYFASCLALFFAEVRAERPVAVIRVTGPKKAQPQSLESGIKHALNKADVEVIDSDDLAEMESAGTEMMVARDLDADFVLSVSIAAVKKSFRADAKLIASKDG